MKKIIIVLIGLISCMGLSAQTYQPVIANTDAFFLKSDFGKDTNNQIICLHVDSAVVKSGKNTYYFTPEVAEYTHTGIIVDGPSWIGHAGINQNDSVFYFKNKYSQSIKIKYDAKLHDTWIAFDGNTGCYSETSFIGLPGSTISYKGIMRDCDSIRIHAKVIAHDKVNFLGITDSVKTISFTMYDYNMNIIPADVNNMTIQISKHYGLIKTCNFNLFPNLPSTEDYRENNLQVLSLVGFSNPKLGVQNLTYSDVFDFNVGDEIHIVEEQNLLLPDWYTLEKAKYRYLSKTISDNKIIFSVEKIGTYYSKYKESITDSLIFDTITEFAYSYKRFDALPGHLWTDDDFIYEDNYTMRKEDTLLMKILPRNIAPLYSCPDCGIASVMDGGSYTPYKYIKGLGGPYYLQEDGWGMMGDYTEKREYVYYKKAGVEWGTPLNIGNNTTTATLDIAQNIRIYPNPTSDIINIRVTDNAQLILIASALGKTIYSKVVDATHVEINLKELTAQKGIYFIQIFDEQNDQILREKLFLE